MANYPANSRAQIINVYKIFERNKEMKKIKLIFPLLLLFALSMFAQTTTDNITEIQRAGGKVLRWDSMTVDSAGVNYSQALDLTLFDNVSTATYPVPFSYRAVKTTSNDSLNFSVEWWGCDLDPTVNANWKVIDTLATVAVLKSTSAPTVTFSTHDLNNTKCAYNKVKIRNNYTNDFTLNFGMLFYLKD